MDDEQLRQEMLEKQKEYLDNLPSWEEIKKNIRVSRKKRIVPRKLKKEALFRDNYRCRICGRNYYLEGHHIILVMFGGEEILENVITLCSECHRTAPDNPHKFIKYLDYGMDAKTYNSLRMAKYTLQYLLENHYTDIGQARFIAKYEDAFRWGYNKVIESLNKSHHPE